MMTKSDPMLTGVFTSDTGPYRPEDWNFATDGELAHFQYLLHTGFTEVEAMDRVHAEELVRSVLRRIDARLENEVVL